MDYTARRLKLKELAGADAIAIVPGANMKYFTGLDYHLSERPIIALFTGDELSFIVPELEVPQIHARPDLEVRLFTWTDKDGYQGAFNTAVEALGLTGKTLGVDDKTMRLFEWLGFLEADPDMKLEEFGKDLLWIRSQKDTEEVDAMREAIRLSEQALDNVLPRIEPGMTERDISTMLDIELSELGCQGLAFKSLIQTGPNSALPHGDITDRALQSGELLLIDYGGMYQSYPADITRTFFIGTPSAEIQKIYDTVLAANQAAIAAAGPGVECGVVDQAARDVITKAGYGEYFIHRTGHGLGLETHELPQMAAGVEDVLKPGMIFTVEPGIYIPGLGGVRIEDDVLVTETGVEVLTHYRYGLNI
ncbi:MAG TPA: Xaa-Pro peptidase family protein [Phototrophicaceae bacterium]|jgi:Xaa-Pro dipeptidase|nr:Xaa-Pro peptidase family protein [Phototrophicaceae bacterium]